MEFLKIKTMAKKDKNKQSKRKFILSAMAVAAFALFWSMFRTKSVHTKKIKLLTADGKLVEVEKNKIKTNSKGRVSNKEILNWMKTNEK